MLELDDIKYGLKDLEKRLNELGESLWHCFKKAGKSKRSVKQVLSQSDSAKIQAKIMKELENENNQWEEKSNDFSSFFIKNFWKCIFSA